jgi:hypothetical protein
MSEIWRYLLFAWIVGPPIAVLYFLAVMVGVAVVAERAAESERNERDVDKSWSRGDGPYSPTRSRPDGRIG